MSPPDRPPALPPETRTVGQVVAESIQFYRSRFWASLALGLPLAAVDEGAFGIDRVAGLVYSVTVGGALLTVAYVRASWLVSGVAMDGRTFFRAWAAGFVAFLPFPVLVLLFALPGVAWLGLVGLVVPVIVIERLGFRDGFRRAVQLARADYVHALGSLATLAITFVLTRLVLLFLLRGQGEATDRVAVFLADVVVSPVMFLGSALLYFDQAARVVGSAPRPKRRRDADVHPALEPDRPGRADAEVEPRPAARGER